MPVARQPIPARTVLTPKQLRAKHQQHHARKAHPVTVAVATAPAAPAAAKPLRVPLTCERLSVFATLTTIENRPVEDVLGECLCDMAAHLARSRHAFHLHEADRISLEVDAEGRAAREGTTPTMLANAAAFDAREAYPAYHDDEASEEAHRFCGAGYVEITMAMEA